MPVERFRPNAFIAWLQKRLGSGIPEKSLTLIRNRRLFAEAERQGSPEAKYAMSTYFSLGVSGVADQDKATAVVYQIDGALSGFKPSVQRLRELLAQVARSPRQSQERDFR